MSTRPRLAGALCALAIGAAGLATVPAGATAGSALPQSGDAFRPQLVTVDTPTRADKRRLQGLGLDLTEHAGHDYVEVVLHSAADLATLTGSGLTHDVRIPDLLRRSAEVNAINARYAATTARSALPSGRTTYRTLADYERDMAALAASRPTVVKRISLPHRTLEGRTVRGLEIGADVSIPSAGRPTFVLMGLHHAREWPSGELAMEFATDLVQSFGTDPRITGLLQRARVVVVPVVNPDGFDLSRTDGELIDLRALNDSDPLGGTTSIVATPGHAYKRKNCRLVDGQDTPDGSCRATLTSNLGAGAGVDLNRNYGGFWGGPGAAGPMPGGDGVGLGVLDPTYRGAAPFSEPETQNIRELVSGRQVTMLISNHTFSNLVLRPNGVHPDTIGHDGRPVGDAPDEDALAALGAEMTDANGYANIHGWQLYDTTGTTEDWSYNATGGFGYTFEIGANEFHPPYPQVVDEYLGAGAFAGKGNREAYLQALEHASDTRYSGVLTGKAKPGTVLRLSKTFQTPTWEDSFTDRIDTAMTVPAGGGVTWIVNPSTRPVVRARTIREVGQTPTSTTTMEGTAAPATSTDHPFELDAPADLLRIALDWPTPDDLDLEVYRRATDGSLTQVGTSGNLPGQKELVDVSGAAAGSYVLRVVNYASVTPGYTLTATTHTAETSTSPGTVEAYTFTCERDGRVLDSQQLFVDRGQTVRLDLRRCRG